MSESKIDEGKVRRVGEGKVASARCCCERERCIGGGSAVFSLFTFFFTLLPDKGRTSDEYPHVQ